MPIGVNIRTVVLVTTFTFAVVAVACGGASKDVPKQAPEWTGTGTMVSGVRPDHSPIMVGGHAIIRQQAVGPLNVGEWRRPVMSFVYAISARAGRDSTDIIVVHGLGKDTVTLSFQNDTLRNVFITHAGPHTADGIGVGTPFAMLAARQDAKTITRGTARVATISGMCGVEFATDSLALSADTIVHKPASPTAAIRAISVGSCKR